MSEFLDFIINTWYALTNFLRDMWYRILDNIVISSIVFVWLVWVTYGSYVFIAPKIQASLTDTTLTQQWESAETSDTNTPDWIDSPEDIWVSYDENWEIIPQLDSPEMEILKDIKQKQDAWEVLTKTEQNILDIVEKKWIIISPTSPNTPKSPTNSGTPSSWPDTNTPKTTETTQTPNTIETNDSTVIPELVIDTELQILLDTYNQELMIQNIQEIPATQLDQNIATNVINPTNPITPTQNIPASTNPNPNSIPTDNSNTSTAVIWNTSWNTPVSSPWNTWSSTTGNTVGASGNTGTSSGTTTGSTPTNTSGTTSWASSGSTGSTGSTGTSGSTSSWSSTWGTSGSSSGTTSGTTSGTSSSTSTGSTSTTSSGSTSGTSSSSSSGSTSSWSSTWGTSGTPETSWGTATTWGSAPTSESSEPPASSTPSNGNTNGTTAGNTWADGNPIETEVDTYQNNNWSFNTWNGNVPIKVVAVHSRVPITPIAWKCPSGYYRFGVTSNIYDNTTLSLPYTQNGNNMTLTNEFIQKNSSDYYFKIFNVNGVKIWWVIYKIWNPNVDYHWAFTVCLKQ